MPLYPWKCLDSIKGSPFFFPKWERIEGVERLVTHASDGFPHSLILIYSFTEWPTYLHPGKELKKKKFLVHPHTANFDSLSFASPLSVRNFNKRSLRNTILVSLLVKFQLPRNKYCRFPAKSSTSTLSPAELFVRLYYCQFFATASLEGWAFRVF